MQRTSNNEHLTTNSRTNRNKKSVVKSQKSEVRSYAPHKIEPYWQSKWQEEKIYQPDLDNAKRPFYNLMMFPYPSAEGLHVGSIFTYGGIDAYGRFKRMQGYDVFEPIGLDGFGIHSENFAIKVGRSPQEHAAISEKNFYRQLHMIGNGYDWSRKLETYDPRYYKWTQWLFIELFKAGLAYKAKAAVNFCPSCKTVLSDEQVVDGKCERCSSVVEKRELAQWFFRITDYADRLLNNTEKLDWTEKVKIAQKNWIGKSEGVEVVWKVCDTEGREKNEQIITFTTRKDTIPGVTFLVLAPESPYVSTVSTYEYAKAVDAYRAAVAELSNAERQTRKEKSGVFTGSYAKNPFNGTVVPVYVADYVLGGYGTGAVMGMPGHDKRDREFAALFDLPTIFTTQVPGDIPGDVVYTGKGQQINSGEGFDGLSNTQAAEKIFQVLLDKGLAKASTTYHLRDWLISRQRYWGPPIPMIYCERCAKEGKSWFTSPDNLKHRITESSEMAGWYPEKDLPVLLPVVKDFKPLGTGKAPLANYPEFYKTTCPGCGADATRETDVSDTFLDSAWYFFRYLATDIDNIAFDIERVKKWLPVQSYIGGAEHAVLHLLYSRFITMVLCDLGYIHFEEPFHRFRANGLIIKDGAKMSKSKGNVVNPDEYVKKFGADTLRTYLGFVGPFTQGGDFRDTGIEGMNRFLKRVWTLVINGKWKMENGKLSSVNDSMMHQTIKGITEDMEELRFNTAIAKIMTYYNYLSDRKEVGMQEVEVLLKLLAPFAPHMTEELWKIIHGDSRKSVSRAWESIHLSQWPQYDPSKIVSDTVIIAVQINGKVRDTKEFRIQNSELRNMREEIESAAKQCPNVKKYLEGKQIRKTIYVPGKIINFVV